MKTLGQIAHDVFYFLKPQPASDDYDGGVNEDSWEAAAQAVRAQVIEECADALVRKARRMEMSHTQRDIYAAAEIVRLLKEKTGD